MAHKDPGKLTFGSINPGSTQNLTAHLFKQRTGIDAVIVPYKAVPDLITALIRGDVDVGVDYFAGFQPVAGDTRIKIIATTGVRRSASAAVCCDRQGKRLPRFRGQNLAGAGCAKRRSGRCA